MKQEYRYIFYKNDEPGYKAMKVRLPEEKCEKFCLDKGFKSYKIMNLHSLLACHLHLLTDIVYLNNKYYFPEDIIPYPEKEPDNIGKFQSSFIWDNEYANDEVDFEEVYNKQTFSRGFGYLWTEVTTKIILPDKTVELAPIAQEIVKYLSEFLNKLKKENHAIYINEEYSSFKWLAWIKDEKVRLIHQNYQEADVITEFDVLLDKAWFFHFGFNMIETMKNYAKSDLKRYQKYVLEKYGKLCKESISYPNTEPADVGKFEIRTEVKYNNEQDFEDTYNTKDELFTSVYTYLTLDNNEEEVIIIAQDFSKNFPFFLVELENIENAVYDDCKYTETKLYGWIKGDKVRLVYQDFSSDEHEIIFDIMVEKDWFFKTSEKLIKQMKEITEQEEQRYNKYIKEKYGESVKQDENN